MLRSLHYEDENPSSRSISMNTGSTTTNVHLNQLAVGSSSLAIRDTTIIGEAVAVGKDVHPGIRGVRGIGVSSC